MNNNTPKPPSKPKRINKYYWLDKGYEMVDGGLARVYNQIKNINTYINGLLTVYVLGTIIDSIYLEIDIFWKLLLIMSPIIIIKWATFYGKISVLPEVKSFYPDSADSSEETYYQYLEEGQKHVKKLKNYAFNATIALVLALVVVTWFSVQSKIKASDEKNPLKVAKADLKKATDELGAFKKLDIYKLNTKVVKEDKKLYVEASLPQNKMIEIKLLNKNKDTALFPSKELFIGDSGKLYFDYDLGSLPQTLDTLLIRLKYRLTKTEEREISRVVSLIETLEAK